ncbi:Aha1 domain family [Metarhizium rileyi]|uniref:Aha1 domain family n=1 Tax=Metarhizium rileyi (strain RCEF 4871) TaxID=1649241 RepID=A0A162K0H9_METRR|nr:Aha1 domain family [Metarhizium rileyi RCEF 4871]
MVLHNPNNWHWVTKDVTAWTKNWLEDKISELNAQKGDVEVKITEVQSIDGEAEVYQRKGKVKTVFDLEVILKFVGSAPEADKVSGTIKFPELQPDIEDYTFEVKFEDPASKDNEPVKELIRSQLVKELEETFKLITSVLIEEHGKDIQHAPGSNPSSGFSTPKVHPQNSSPKPAELSSAPTSTSGIVNTTTVTDNEEFRTTAEEMYQTFVDPQRLAAFTRSPPKLFEGAHKGGKFELFGGNVSGEYLELEPGKKIVQSWRLSQWPAGHFSELHIDFDQNNVDHVTLMSVQWKGVPVGQEEVTKRNWLEYYVKSIKQTFGFGTIL